MEINNQIAKRGEGKMPNNRWERATKLACPYLRTEDNPFNYRKDESPSFWLALKKDPCPTCDNSSCHNYKHKFDEPKRLIIIKTGEK